MKSGVATNANYGIVPQAYIKLQPTAAFSIEGGKLPTLIGDEYTFSYENLNIERGLLWNAEPAVSRGVQANYTQGPIAVSVSLERRLVLQPVQHGVRPRDLDHHAVRHPGRRRHGLDQVHQLLGRRTTRASTTSCTPTPWVRGRSTPTSSTNSIPKFKAAGQLTDQTITSRRLAGQLRLRLQVVLAGVSLPIACGILNPARASESYNAYSVTFTPTFQYKIYFIRAEVSYVAANVAVFGVNGNEKDQTRGLIETGVLF